MSESDESNMPPFIGLAKPLAYLYENKETGGKIPLIDRIVVDDRYIETPLIALSEVPPQKPDWDSACEAMRWLNDIEAMQGGRSGPSIKLRTAIEAMAGESKRWKQTVALQRKAAVATFDAHQVEVKSLRAAIKSAINSIDAGRTKESIRCSLEGALHDEAIQP